MQSRCRFHLPSQEEDEPSDLTAILAVFSMNSSYVTVQTPLGVSFIHSIHRVVGHKVSFRGEHQLESGLVHPWLGGFLLTHAQTDSDSWIDWLQTVLRSDCLQNR